MKGIFFVEAPFQLISAYEAIKFYKISSYKIIVRYCASKNSDNQLKLLATNLFGDDRRLSFITITGTTPKNIIDYFKIITLISYSFIICRIFDYVFVGNFDSKLLKPIVKFSKKKKVILLDDGIKNILIQNEFNPGYNYNMFTMLTSLVHFPTQVIDYNRFDEFKKMILNERFKYSNKIVFIGTCISEKQVLDEDRYVDLIYRITKEHNKKLVYIPHRMESPDKIQRIEKISNVECCKIDYPIELYFYNNEILPSSIISFYSAALISLKCLYSITDTRFISFKFDYSHCETKSDIDKVYSYLSNYVEIIEV